MKIDQRFDPSLDSYPELKVYAEMAADYLKREAVESGLPTKAIWRVNRDSVEVNPVSRSREGPVEVELRDDNLGIGLSHAFTMKDLKGDRVDYHVLRVWGDFLELRNGYLVDRLVASANAEGKTNP